MLDDYNAAGYYFQQLSFAYNSIFEQEVEQVIEICEHLSKAKLKTEKNIEDLLSKCISVKNRKSCSKRSNGYFQYNIYGQQGAK